MVADWDDASAAGPEVLRAEVAAADRGGPARPPMGRPRSVAGAPLHASRSPGRGAAQAAAGPGTPCRRVAGAAASSAGRRQRRRAARLARRGGSARPISAHRPAEPWPMSSARRRQPSDDGDEPPVPDEARARIVADAATPRGCRADTVLHVRFASVAPSDRVIGAMETFKGLRDRPGETRVVIHVPDPGWGRRWNSAVGLAYDGELLTEIRRRLGHGLVESRLAAQTRVTAARRVTASADQAEPLVSRRPIVIVGADRCQATPRRWARPRSG
jgi:hypothetical protein